MLKNISSLRRLLSVVSPQIIGSRCTRLTIKTTLRHIGSTEIRRLTAGGVVASRTRTSTVFDIHLPALKTGRAGTITSIRAKWEPVSIERAVCR